jgi:hypothetical protein
MIFNSVDPATIRVWRWHSSFAALFIVIASTVVSLAVPGNLWPFAPVLIALLVTSICWFWPAAAYRHLRFGVDDTGIVIHSGVVFRSHIALPRVRIQHTDVSQGPLQRRFGVATLKFYTAGSRHTKIELPGLTHHRAVELRDALLAVGRDSGV